MSKKTKVLLIATLDTKETEAFFIKDCLQQEGMTVLMMDPGIRGTKTHEVTVGPDEIAAAAGKTLKNVRQVGHEGKALKMMIEGAIKCALSLFETQPFDGIIALGGSMGTTLGGAVMQSFPIGLPKVMISTMASGMTKPFVGTKDILMLHSVADISGLNTITRQIFQNGASALAGMARTHTSMEASDKPLVAISTLGTTEACSRRVRTLLEDDGCEVVTFHTNGTGGRAMDEIIADRDVAVVVDMSLIEISDNLYGGYFDAGPERGKAALEKGIPTIIAPGNIDFLVAGPIEDARQRFPGKKYHCHNEAVTAVRAEREEFERIGEYLSGLWNKAKGPVRVFIPIKGFSSHDSEAGHLYEPELPPYFVNTLKKHLDKGVKLEVLDCHINDDEFAHALVHAVNSVMQS